MFLNLNNFFMFLNLNNFFIFLNLIYLLFHFTPKRPSVLQTDSVHSDIS